jgi:hypothetical protein
MYENQYEPVVKEKFYYKKHVQIGVVLLVAASVIGGVTYVTLIKPQAVTLTAVNEAGETVAVNETIGADAATQVNEILAQDFVFTILSDAQNRVTMVAPVDTTDADNADFKTKHAALTEEQRSRISDDTLDSSFYIEGQQYYAFVNSSARAADIFQLHDEVNALVTYFNKQYNKPTPTERSKEITAETANDSSATGLVYPSKRVAEGYVAAAIATALNPDNADLYQKIAADYAERGVAYGWYSESDLIASKDMVTQYLATDEVKNVLSGLQGS